MGKTVTEAHYIVVDGETYSRLVKLAEARKIPLDEFIDHAINRTLNAAYSGRGKAQ